MVIKIRSRGETRRETPRRAVPRTVQRRRWCARATVEESRVRGSFEREERSIERTAASEQERARSSESNAPLVGRLAGHAPCLRALDAHACTRPSCRDGRNATRCVIISVTPESDARAPRSEEASALDHHRHNDAIVRVQFAHIRLRWSAKRNEIACERSNLRELDAHYIAYHESIYYRIQLYQIFVSMPISINVD